MHVELRAVPGENAVHEDSAGRSPEAGRDGL